MIGSLKKLTYILYICGVIDIVLLFKVGFNLHDLLETEQLMRSLIFLFWGQVVTAVVIFVVAIVLQLTIKEIESEEIWVLSRFSQENKEE